MKLQKMLLMLVLVLVVAAVLVVPVAADKPESPLPFTFNAETFMCSEPYESGMVWHWYCYLDGHLAFPEEPMLDGAYIYLELWEPANTANPHPLVVGTAWAPVRFKWYTVSAADPGSGFEGTGHMNPWTDPAKWPNSLRWFANGNGYGAYKAMKLTFSCLDAACEGSVRE